MQTHDAPKRYTVTNLINARDFDTSYTCVSFSRGYQLPDHNVVTAVTSNANPEK